MIFDGVLTMYLSYMGRSPVTRERARPYRVVTGRSRVRNYFGNMRMELLVLLMMLCICGSHVVDYGETGKRKIGEPCRDISYDETDDDYVFKWPQPDEHTSGARVQSPEFPLCLRDIEQCQHGFTAIFNLTSDSSDIDTTNDQVIDFAPPIDTVPNVDDGPGGWRMPVIVQRKSYDNNYIFKVQVLTNDLIWESRFASLPAHPMLVGVTWRYDVGLDVYVDNLCTGFVDEPRIRYEEDEQELKGALHSFPLNSFHFVEYLKPAESVVNSESEEAVFTYYLGCLDNVKKPRDLFSTSGLKVVPKVDSCRRLCQLDGSLYAFVSENRCTCDTDLVPLDSSYQCGRVCVGYESLPCGSADKWSVYLTSSVITSTGNDMEDDIYNSGMDLLPDGIPIPVLPPPSIERRFRNKRSALYEESTQDHLIRRRRSAEFIHVDDVDGIVNTDLNFTYVIQTNTKSLSCTWDFGDGTTITQVDAEHWTQVYHTYSQPGHFSVSVNCDNGLQDSVSATTRSSLQGLTFTITQHSQISDTLSDVELRVSKTSGTWPMNALFILNEEEIPFVETVPSVFDTVWVPSYFGVFQINAVISNKFDEDILLSVNVTVGQEISGLAITALDPVGTNLPVSIFVHVSAGSNVTADVDFGNGNRKINQALINKEISLTQSYTTTGIKDITVTASNVFGSALTNRSIEVLQSVIGLQMSVNPSVVDIGENVEVTLTAGSTVIPNVECMLLTGDGRHYVWNNVALDNMLSIVKSFNYSQDFTEAVKISATCSNSVSNQTIEKEVVVGKEVQSCSIVAPVAQRAGESKETIISVQGGHDLQLAIDYGDGSFDTIFSDGPGDIPVNHSFANTGTYNITVSVTNPNTSTAVECDRANATVIVQNVIPAEDLFTLTAFPNAIDLTTGTRINFTIMLNTDQSLPEDTYYTFLFSRDCTCSLSIKVEDHETETGAIYNTSGTYTVTAIVSNRVSAFVKQIQVGALFPMDGFTVTPSGQAFLVGDLVEFTVLPINGTEIRINVTWGDGSYDYLYLPSPTSITFNHTYISDGEYEVCTTVQNDISLGFDPDCHSVKILYPVEGLSFDISVDIVLGNSAQFIIGLHEGTPEPSEMTCVIDRGDGENLEPTVNSFPTRVQCNYAPAVKNYQATLYCSNSLGSYNQNLAVIVRKPIPEIFELQVDSDFYYLSEALVEYTLSIKGGEDIPVGYADFEWYYGDGNFSRKNMRMPDRSFQTRYRFINEGSYMTNLRITYGLWTGMLSVNMTVAEKRDINVVVVYGQDTVNNGRVGERGRGPNGTWFYEDSLLLFSPHPPYNDTTYLWKYSQVEQETNVRDFEHVFESPGVFAVTLDVRFPLYNDKYVTFVHIVSPTFDLTGINVVDSGSEHLKLKAYSKLNITLTGINMNSPLCILWIFCNETLYFSGPPNCYNAPYDSGEAGVAWITDGQLLTHVEFNTPGEFNLTVIATNNMNFSDSIQQSQLTITIVGCTGPPEVTIRGSGRLKEHPRQYLRSEAIYLASTVRLRCFGLEEAPRFQWATALLDSSNPNVTSTDLDSEELPEYTFPSLTFAVALYNLTMTVTVTETSPPLSGVDFVYMRIERTPIIVIISGGSARTVNGDIRNTFDASESRDPDEALEDQNLSLWNFTWSCYRVPVVASPDHTTTTPQEGICEYPSEHILEGESQRDFSAGANSFAINVKYVIKVTAVHNDGREGSYEQEILTVQGDPVSAQIECYQNCLTKVNPTSEISYQARCTNCVTQNATYFWEMQVGKENRHDGDLQAKAATNLTKRGLVIRANVLEGGEFYYVRVYVAEPGLVRGFTEISFYTNLPPHGGSCSMSPLEGNALETDFTAECIDWSDEGDLPTRLQPGDDQLLYDPILTYRVQYRRQGDERYTQLVAAGELSVIPNLKFPSGREEQNYTLEILFTVLDKFGGMDTANATIQVRPVTKTAEELTGLFRPGGELHTLTNSKDAGAVYILLGAVLDVVAETHLPPDEAVKLKDESLIVMTNMSALAKTSDSINQAAASFGSIYYADPPPSVTLTINAVTSMDEMASNYGNLNANNADDIKRTGESIILTCGKIIASSLPSTSSRNTSSTSATVSPEEAASNQEVNDYEMRIISIMLDDALDKTNNEILSSQVPGQEPAITESSDISVQLQVSAPEDLGTGSSPIQIAGAVIEFPQAFDLIGPQIEDNLVQSKILIFSPATNPLGYGEGSDDIRSGVTQIKFQQENGEAVNVTDSPRPVEIQLSTNSDLDAPEVFTANISQRTPMSYHRIDITDSDKDFRAVIRSDHEDGIWVFAKLQYPPLNNSYDIVQRLPRVINGSEDWLDQSAADEARNTFAFTKEEHCGNGTYYIGVMPAGSNVQFNLLNSTTPKCSGEEARLTLPSDENTTIVPFTYNLSSYVSACQYFNHTMNAWDSGGCWTGEKTTARSTHCLCNHLTSFAAAFFVPPNKIDFSSVFDKNLLENFAVMGTIIAFTSLYLILLIYARRKDKQDLIKWGVTPLSDNHPSHTYGYQVTVETGVRPGAGTKSKVGIMISGEDADTGPRVLDDPKRPIFQAGSICSFLMTVPRPLGLLTYVRIWHDNSGGGGQAGWFLSKVAVMDIQTGKEFFFLCEQWLAVEQGDGDVDRTLFVASKKDLTKVGQLVYTSGRKNLSDQHLWFSLFSRPTRSTFNRCQRLCCCLTLLYTSMIANAMFYQSESTAANTQAIKIGSFTITPQQISIGFMSSLIIMPVNMIIAQIFRKARPLDPDAPDPLIALIRRCFGCCKPKRKDEEKLELFNIEEKRHNKAVSEKQIDVAVISSGQLDTSPEPPPPPPEPTAAALAAKKKYPLPHWTIYIAYALAFVACFISCFFTVLYSLEWGKEKAEEWLGSMITSFFSSAFVIQPAKVIVIVFIVSIIFKKPSKMNDADAEGLKDKTINKLQTDEEYLHEDSLTAGKVPGYSIRPKTPPSKQILQQARKERLRDMQVSGVVKDCLIYALYLIIVLFLAYSNRDPESFRMSETIRNQFVSDKIDYLVDGEEPVTFSALSQSQPDEYWNYIEQTLLPGLYGYKYYNDEEMNWRDARFLRDLQNYRVGPARLRQLRVKPLPCEVTSRMAHVITDCTLDYSWSNQDEGIFAENWTYTCDPSDESIPDYAYYEVDETRPWRYRSAVDLFGVPYSSNLYLYGGGGFIAEFGVSREQAMATAKYLRTHGWYDKYTRAIFIEFTVYNANVNLFSVVTLLLETPTLGGGVPSHVVHTFRLYQYVGGLTVVSLAFQAIFCGYLLYFLGHFIYRLKKEGRKELKNIWMILEGSMLLFGLSAAAMFVMREIFIQFTLREVKKKDEGGFVNFNHIAKWDQIFGYLLAILTFLSILRFMRVLRFSARVTHVAMALHRASKDMLYFLFMWCIIVVAFALWGYAIFSRSVFTFHTFQATLESLLGMMIGSFDFYALQSVEAVIGPIFFTLYIFAAYFMLANMLITIIVEAFVQSKAEPDSEDKTFPIAKHMMSKFKTLLASYGIGSNSVGPAPKKQVDKETDNKDDGDNNDDENEGEDSAYQDMMETIEKRVDQLVCYVIKNYGDGKGGATMGSKATLNTFEAMVKKDIEAVKQRKARTIFVT